MQFSNEIEPDEIEPREIKLDESYFGGTHKRKPGENISALKVAILGLLKLEGYVYNQITVDTKTNTCQLFHRK